MARVVEINAHVQWGNQHPDVRALSAEFGGVERSLGHSFGWSTHLWTVNSASLPSGLPNPKVEVVAGTPEDPTVAIGVPLDPALPLTDQTTWVTIASRGDGATPAGLRRVAYAIRAVARFLSQLTTMLVGKDGKRTVRVFSNDGAAVMLRVLHYVVRRLADPAFILMARRAGQRLCVDGDQPLHAIATGDPDSDPSGRTGRRLMHGAFFGPLAESEWSEGSPYMDARQRFALELIIAAHGDDMHVSRDDLSVLSVPSGMEALEAAEAVVDFLGIDRVNCQHPNAHAVVEQYLAFVETLPDVDGADDEAECARTMTAYHRDNAAAVREAFETLLKAPVAASAADHAAAVAASRGSADGFVRHETVTLHWDGYECVLTIAVFANPLGDLAPTFAQTALPTVQHPAYFMYATLEDAICITNDEYLPTVIHDGQRCYEVLGAHQLADYDKSIGVLDFLAERPKKDAPTDGVAPPNLLGFAFVERTCDQCVDTRVYVARSPLVTGSVFAQRNNGGISKPPGMTQEQFDADVFAQRQLFNETFARCLWRAVQAMADGAAEGLMESDELVFHFARVRYETVADNASGGGAANTTQNRGGGKNAAAGTASPGAGASARTVENVSFTHSAAGSAAGGAAATAKYDVVWDDESTPEEPHVRQLTLPSGNAPRPGDRYGEVFCLYAYDASSGPPAAKAESATRFVVSQLARPR